MNTFVDTLVIGAGQAGLATAYHLTRQGRECLVLEGSARLGDNWRQQWDSLRLCTPAKYDGLPGLPFPADAWHYPSKEETADFVERYAATFELPVQLGAPVVRVSVNGDGFRVPTEQGQYGRRNVVVATGTFGRTPYVPDLARDLDPAIMQLHSSQYRRREQLPDGRCSSSAPRTPAATSRTSWARNGTPCWPAATVARSPCRSRVAGCTW